MPEKINIGMKENLSMINPLSRVPAEDSSRVIIALMLTNKGIRSWGLCCMICMLKLML